MIFLIDYDRRSGTLISMKVFDASVRQVAENERLDLEIRNLQQGVASEVVLLEALSEEDLRLTHRRYFERIGELAAPKATD